MSVNTLTFEQVSTVLTSLVKQVTKQTVSTPTDTGSFVSVGQILLRADHDAVLNAISNMVSRTIFSIRPYSGSMLGLAMDMPTWGNMVRKISIADDDWQNDPAYEYPVLFDSTQNPPTGDGGRVDPWTIKKPNLIQTNFYGSSVYFDEMTITEDQLVTAFSSPSEFGNFLTLVMTNLSNRLETSNEALRKGLVCNAIGAIYHEDQNTTGGTDRVIHLLTMYNSAIGESFTVQDVYHPDNFPAFVKWAYAVIEDTSDMMTKRGIQYQTTINNKNILRHTPKQFQKLYMYSPFLREVTSRVLADTYHDTILKLGDVEAVPYWQSMNVRDKVDVFPVYTGTNGSVVYTTGTGNNVEVENVLGIMFDREFMGMSIQDRRVLSTGLNTKGLYRNIHVHGKQKIMMDNSEKAVIFVLD